MTNSPLEPAPDVQAPLIRLPLPMAIGLILVGVRSIAQQVVDALYRERSR